MAIRSLGEPFDAMGEWYLPERNRRIAGTLSYKMQGATLNLSETLEEIAVGQTIRLGIDDFHTYPVVHGIINTGEAITILNAIQMGSAFSFSSGGVRTPVSLLCGTIIIDGHVNSETGYSDIECFVPGLEAWFSAHSITGGYKAGGISLETVAHQKEVTTISETKADITFANEFQFTPGAHAASIKTLASFSIKSDAPRDLQWYFDQVFKITNLLSLLAGLPMPPNKITLSVEGADRRLSVLTTGLDLKLCHLTREWEFFISRSAMGENYQQVLRNWFSLYPKIEMACGLALSVLNADDLWTHVEFLSLMQALEGLHRALYDGTYMDVSEYLEVYDTLVNAIPTRVSQSHRQALISRIKYGNEISLRKRLRALEDNLSPAVRHCILGETGRIPKAWIDTRNYYTHWDEVLRANVLTVEDMHYASMRLKALVRVLYLHFVGVSDDLLLSALKNNSRASRDLKIAAHANIRRQTI